MNGAEIILRLILEVRRGQITIPELMESYTRITGTSIHHEDPNYWILTEYLISIYSILSPDRGHYNHNLDTLVTSKKLRDINTTEMNSFSSYETNLDINRQTILAEEVHNRDDQGFITIKSKRKGKAIVQSDTGKEEQRGKFPGDPYFIDVNPGYYYWDDDFIVEDKNLGPPCDIVDFDYKIPRDSFSCEKGKILSVIVDQVYDISKFWLHRNDGRLHSLTEAMNCFYGKRRNKYLIPEEHMDIGRYCVTFTMNRYNRCVIVKKKPDVSYVNVYFIDYGILDKMPKDQAWFLTNYFSWLPAQAIRARLANIHPPTEHTPWSLEAINRFHSLVYMKPFDAAIVIISNGEAEVCLVSESYEFIDNILVKEGHALFKDEGVQNKKIRDTHCMPMYRNIHLFPDFNEIEQWLVPSVEEIREFCHTDLNAEYFFLHCYWRPFDFDDHIEKKVKKATRRQQKCVKYIQSSELMNMITPQEMNESYFNYLADFNGLIEDYLYSLDRVDLPAGVAYISKLSKC